MFLRRLTYVGSICLMSLGGCQTEDPLSIENSPSISKMKPSQATRGQRDVTARIHGSNFVGMVVVNLGAGVDVQETAIVDSTALDVTFSVKPEASAGPRDITIRTLSGTVHNSGVFSISDNAIPTANFTISPTGSAGDMSFSFDGSGSADSDGTIQSYDWSFGDGATASGPMATHAYASAGTFQVSLTVADNAQAKATATRGLTITNNKPPAANFTILPRNGNTKTLFSFDGSDSKDNDGRITDYVWDFQDGQTDQGKKVTHRFQHDGSFSVTLTVTDNGGTQSSVSKDVRVSGALPIAEFLVSPSSGPKTTNFQFDASASHDPDGSVQDYAWNLDDGTTGNGKIFHHQFSIDGDHTIRLTVTDNGGSTGSAEKTVSVASSGGGGGPVCPDPERVYVDDGGVKPFCNSFKLPRTYGPDHPVTVTAVYDKKLHRVMDIRVYNGDGNDDYCCQSLFFLCTEFRNASGVYIFGASAFEIGPYGTDSGGNYRDYYLYRGGPETFGQWPPTVGDALVAHFVPCK